MESTPENLYNAEAYAGRSYAYGVKDCYTLIQDWFKNEAGVILRDYPRPADWFQAQHDLFQEGFPQEGFKVVDIPFSRLEPGDLIFCGIAASYMNHCAVYVGQGKILHHLSNRVSVVEPLTKLVRNTCLAIARRPGLSLAKPVIKKMDLRDVAPERNAPDLLQPDGE